MLLVIVFSCNTNGINSLDQKHKQNYGWAWMVLFVQQTEFTVSVFKKQKQNYGFSVDALLTCILLQHERNYGFSIILLVSK